MRRLLLIRHAKSSWKHPELGDHERPLNKRGQRDVLTMSRHLADKDEPLDVIYSSTATRALDLAQAISETTHVELVPELSFYTFDADELIQIIKHLPTAAHRAAVVGHNPAITRAVNLLSGSDLDNVPTSGIAALNCPIDDWQQLGQGDCELDYFDYPKMFL